MMANGTYRKLRRIASTIYHLPSNTKRISEFRRAQNELCSGNLTALERRLLQQVSLNVCDSDAMYGAYDSAMDYLTAGLSAVHCIEAAMEAGGQKGSVGSVLDFPCGHGRELRFLKVLFPDASIVGGEVNSSALDFCKRVFSTETFRSQGNFDDLNFPRKFDLIWCGSLITHLNEESSTALLGFFYRHLLDGGTCIFTTHGVPIAKSMRSRKGMFRLSTEGEEELLRNFDQHGFGFADYRGGLPGWGISVSSRSRITEMAGSVGIWEQTLYLENGWHNFQDVYAYAKPPRNKR